MTNRKQVHAEEVETDAALARRLLAAQFPRWAALPLEPVQTDSTDNDMYRLGADMAVRLPRRAGAVTPMDKEHEWLPRLAPHLPLPVPLARAKGAPEGDYPYPWSVVTWIEGTPPPPQVDDRAFARDLAAFVTALHALDASTGPAPGAHNFWRGMPLARFDATLRQRFDWLSDVADIDATWARGRAWALIEGVFALSYYRGKNEAIAEAGRRVIDVVLADR